MDVLERSERGTEPQPGAHRWLVWSLIAIIGVAIVLAAVLGGLRQPPAPDEGTPEGVVQAYLQAVLDDDVATARGYLSEDLAVRCTTRDFRDTWVPEALTASLGQIRHTDGTAEVEVRLREVEGPPPFGAGGFTTVEVFELSEHAGEWRLDVIPWPLYDCRGVP